MAVGRLTGRCLPLPMGGSGAVVDYAKEIQMPEFSDKNVFEMYVANGMRAGFWLRRTTWGNTCARVVDVGEIKGPAPYFGNPKVYADIYDLRTGELKEARARIPAAGTYKTWRLIDAPSWWTSAD